ncbi:MAG TPA: hypothetical protein VNU68_07195 [Verrucomicrobiae bacterium]|nr:hypothetical protein [Verrucomicrobiae bacterium]
MFQLKTIPEIVGKTVQRVAKHNPWEGTEPNRTNVVAVFFTDDTFIRFSALSRWDYKELVWDEPVDGPREECGLGFITPAQCAMLLAEKAEASRKERERQTEAAERAQYAKLKAKYEPIEQEEKRDRALLEQLVRKYPSVAEAASIMEPDQI